MVSWSLHEDSSVHHVVVPGFGRYRSGGACLDTWEAKRKQGQVCGTWQHLQPGWDEQEVCISLGSTVSYAQGKGKQASLQVWRRIITITGKETLMWMNGFLNTSVRVGNTVSLSFMHTSSQSIACTSLDGIKAYPRQIRRALCIFLTASSIF